MLEAAKTASEKALDVAKDVTKAMFEMAHFVREYSQLSNEMTDEEAYECFSEVKELTARAIADAKKAGVGMKILEFGRIRGCCILICRIHGDYVELPLLWWVTKTRIQLLMFKL